MAKPRNKALANQPKPDSDLEQAKKILERLDSDEISDVFRNPKIESRIMSFAMREFVGPIPPPDLLEHYSKINPEFATEIVNAAREERHFRHEQERRMLELKVRKESLGLHYAIAAAGAALLCATLLGMYSHHVVASVIGGGTLLGMVTIFVTGRASVKKPRDGE